MAVHFDLNSFLETAAQTATGLLQGQEMARQQQEQQALQAFSLQQQMAAQQREQAMAPYQALTPHLGQFDPGSRAQILGGLSRTSQMGQGPSLDDLRAMLPRGSRLAGMLPQGQPQPTAFPAAGMPPAMPGMGGTGVTPASEGAAVGGARTITGPGGEMLSLGGVSRERLAAIQGRYKSVRDVLQKIRPDSPVAATLRQHLQGINLNPQTEEEARATEERLAAADLSSQSGSPLVRQAFEQDVERHGESFNELIKPGVAPGRAVRGFIDLYDEGERLREEGKIVGGFVPSYLVDWADDIKAMREAVARGTPEGRQEAAEIAERMQGAIGRNLTPDQALRETALGLSVLGKIDPARLNDKEFVAQQLEVAGLPAFAARVRERGTAIGTGEARKEFRRLLGMIPGFKDLPAQARAELAEQIVGAARAAGETVKLTAKDLQKFDPVAMRRFAMLGKQLSVFDERERRAAEAEKRADESHKHKMAQLRKISGGLDVPQTLNNLWDMRHAANQEKKRILAVYGVTEANFRNSGLDDDEQQLVLDAIAAETAAAAEYKRFFDEHAAGRAKAPGSPAKSIPGPYKKPPIAEAKEGPSPLGEAGKKGMQKGAAPGYRRYQPSTSARPGAAQAAPGKPRKSRAEYFRAMKNANPRLSDRAINAALDAKGIR